MVNLDVLADGETDEGAGGAEETGETMPGDGVSQDGETEKISSCYAQV